MSELIGVPDTTVLGTVHLRVTDVDRALSVWRDLIGLSVLSHDGDAAILGLAGRPMIALQGGASPPAPDKVLGLFHVAVHVPTRADLATVLARLVAANHRHSGQDHLLSEALYFADPDGNGIEIALDTPHRGRIERDGTEGKAFANDGTRHSMLEPLDLVTLLAELPAGADISGLLPATSHIGHIHFRTNARDAVFAFYKDVIGLMPSINSASFRFCDVGTARRRHMVAFNTWGGESLPSAAPDAPGVIAFTVLLADTAAVEAIRLRLYRAGVPVTKVDDVLTCDDPEGNRVHLTVRAA